MTMIYIELIFKTIIEVISESAVPIIFFVIPIYGFYKKIKVYETFVEGAKEGFTIAVRIIPYLVAILVAIAIFRGSGGMNTFMQMLQPLTSVIGFPPEAIPMAIMRPLSGSGALGVMNDIFLQYGADSFVGKLVSTIQGSTETTFYILAVYFGSVGVKKNRHVLPAALTADFIGVVAGFIICSIVFAS